MPHHIQISDVPSNTVRAPWRIEDALPQGAVLDFAFGAVSESSARTAAIRFPAKRERRTPAAAARAFP